MRSPKHKLLIGALAACLASSGCSKKTEEPPPAPVEEPPVSEPQAKPQAAVAPTTAVNVQQTRANWDMVSKQIASQDYDNAVRQAIQLNQAQQQAQLSEAMRQEYQRRLYEAQEALRQRAETDAKAREAYQKLGRALMGR